MQKKPSIYTKNPCPPCPKTARAPDKAAYWLGVGLGSGLSPRAAGTVGTLAVLPFLAFALYLGAWVYGAVLVLLLASGTWICGRTSHLMNVHDDPHIVFDEWAGMWLCALPLLGVSFGTQRFWVAFLMAFFLFRVFDVLKPFPIGYLDKRVHGGFGIMLDDILAGIMAALVLFSIIALIFL